MLKQDKRIHQIFGILYLHQNSDFQKRNNLRKCSQVFTHTLQVQNRVTDHLSQLWNSEQHGHPLNSKTQTLSLVKCASPALKEKIRFPPKTTFGVPFLWVCTHADEGVRNPSTLSLGSVQIQWNQPPLVFLCPSAPKTGPSADEKRGKNQTPDYLKSISSTGTSRECALLRMIFNTSSKKGKETNG